ncbi:exported hypothetical protein [Tenacibaculum sp. 190524A02b]|uniref:Bacterial EndoU nuclease domain-containing protein n=1 Tax=Tenacibaculum vairaonense TaxID=3137860 RepID=A0ABM9PN81_9FLAO
MKNSKKKLKNLLKLGMFLLGFSLLMYSCQSTEVLDIPYTGKQEASFSSSTYHYVTQEEVPEILKAFDLVLKNKVIKSSLNQYTFNNTPILELEAKDGSKTYSILLPLFTDSEYEFNNLVIQKKATGALSSPLIKKYTVPVKKNTLENNTAGDWVIDTYTLTDFINIHASQGRGVSASPCNNTIINPNAGSGVFSINNITGEIADYISNTGNIIKSNTSGGPKTGSAEFCITKTLKVRYRCNGKLGQQDIDHSRDECTDASTNYSGTGTVTASEQKCISIDVTIENGVIRDTDAEGFEIRIRGIYDVCELDTIRKQLQDRLTTTGSLSAFNKRFLAYIIHKYGDRDICNVDTRRIADTKNNETHNRNANPCGEVSGVGIVAPGNGNDGITRDNAFISEQIGALQIQNLINYTPEEQRQAIQGFSNYLSLHNNSEAAKQQVKKALEILPHLNSLKEYWPKTPEEWAVIGEVFKSIAGEVALGLVPGYDFIEAVQHLIEGNMWSAALAFGVGVASFSPGIIAKIGKVGVKLVKAFNKIIDIIKPLGKIFAKGFKPKIVDDVLQLTDDAGNVFAQGNHVKAFVKNLTKTFDEWLISLKNNSSLKKHIFDGDLRSVTGCHYRGAVDNINIRFLDNKIPEANSLGVLKGNIEMRKPLLNSRGEIIDYKWVKKNTHGEPQTFFPSNWSKEKILEECSSALSNPKKGLVTGKTRMYEAESNSGIFIRWFEDVNGNIKSIFPEF